MGVGWVQQKPGQHELIHFETEDFPGGPVVKNPPCNAEDSGSIPDQGTKIPHTAEKLSSWDATTEVQVPQLENLFATVKDLV